jgi:hypothetical protein
VKLAASNPTEQRRQLLLLGVLVVVALVVWYTTSPDDAATEAAATASNPAVTPKPVAPAGGAGKRGKGTDSGNELPEPVRLADLEPVPEQSSASRNPFGFGVPPAPPPPPPQPQAPPPPPPPPPAPPAVPPLPPIPVKFLGFVEDPARPGKVVALGINGGTMLAREGDLVDGRYRLVKVGLESIVMAYPDGRGQQTIRLSGE